MNSNPLHLVIRFSDTMFGVGDVISNHNEVVNKNKAVWFGKLGGTLSLARIEMLNKQISQNVPTFVYLVKGNRKKSTPYQAQVLAITRDFPKKEKILIPSYYVEKKLLKYMTVWIKMGHIEKIEMDDLRNFKTINSVFPLEETLSRSSSGYFLIHESKSIF